MTSADLNIPPDLRPFLVIGVAAIVGGGIAAAVTGPTGWDRGSWVAAFLVLVGGVGQIALGAGQQIIAAAAPRRRRIVAELLTLNVASALVIAGTLVARPPIVATGSAVFVAALVLFIGAVRHTAAGNAGWRRAYVTLLTILLVSTPIGVALSWIRH